MVNWSPPGTPCVMVTSMDAFSNNLFTPLFILGSWCLFEGKQRQIRFKYLVMELRNSNQVQSKILTINFVSILQKLLSCARGARGGLFPTGCFPPSKRWSAWKWFRLEFDFPHSFLPSLQSHYMTFAGWRGRESPGSTANAWHPCIQLNWSLRKEYIAKLSLQLPLAE